MIISLIRPVIIVSLTTILALASISCAAEGVSLEEYAALTTEPVSYTHLTLPTKA